eukprot:Skav228209  [mRNA]  locus=scaffold3219:101979:102974:- [translate_table: standard]
MRFKSVAGSHTNVGLRAFNHQAMCLMAGMDCLTTGGRWCLTKLKQQDVTYHDACSNGLNWLVIDHRIDVEFPSYARLAQSAANASAQKAENELQLLRKIHGAIASRIGMGHSTTHWDDIKNSVLRSKPQAAGYALFWYGFVMKASGGQDGKLLMQTDSVVTAGGFPARALGSEIYQALSVDLKGADQHILVRHMLLRLAYFIRDKNITQTDIKRVLAPGFQAKRQSAEYIYNTMAAIIGSHPAAPQNFKDLNLGFLSMDLASFLVGKPARAGRRFETIEETAVKLANDWNEHMEPHISCPFKVAEPNPANLQSAASASSKEKGQSNLVSLK